MFTWRRSVRDHDGGAPRWDLFYSASLERDHCQVVSVKSKFVPWGRCYSFGEQNSFGSIVWFSPLALRQRVRGLLEKRGGVFAPGAGVSVITTAELPGGPVLFSQSRTGPLSGSVS
ncbi:hypothetical protein HOLleu_30635 [Holothuria leucospilota]|uniref:Uncharacterized protein n=1 Tax=Holothuria leucospilota TaxID=206669 RepID=A0A9Q1BL00_HOLLE|nr:hypothetical protein HOLleu_30635 [Holothuria leucospilota]